MNVMRTLRRPLKKAKSRIRTFCLGDEGAVLVEFSIMLPVLLLLFAVIVEGGRMLWSYQATAAGVRDASRYLARVSSESICVDGGSVAGSNTQLLNIVRNASDGEGLFPPSITVNSVNPGLRCVNGPYRVSPAAIVTVSANLTITFPFAGLFVLAGQERPTIQTTLEDQHRAFGI